MNRLIALLLGCCLTSSHAADFKIFAPSGSTQQLWVITASTQGDTLKLAVAEKIPLGFPASVVVAHPQRPLLYFAGQPGTDGISGAVLHLGADGKHSTPLRLFHDSCYLSLDRSNRFLLSASYGGQVSVHPLDDAGIPGARVTSLNEGSSCAHSVLTSPDNAFAYVSYVKEHNALRQYRFDPVSGALSALTPSDAKPQNGIGPRHPAFHPTLRTVYYTNEQHLGVSVYEQQADGQLTLKQLCDAVPPETPKDGVSASDLVITADGRFLFSGLRGHKRPFDWIAGYRIAADGTLTLLGLTPVDRVPWRLALSPDGRYLLVSSFDDGTLNALRIDEAGNLTRVATLTWDKHIMDLICRP